ncbi:hypothetical protein CVT26_002003 [Gymnopilus dilepis]|uniref:MFS general substrate transporter n=1 Tax=Gymnopilus dilepis TaxID=231916 RepID=A0A409VE06_9AGAR|nr:hypothetical protein CVT26_002003 [Gymnopilus dilepis]
MTRPGLERLDTGVSGDALIASDLATFSPSVSTSRPRAHLQVAAGSSSKVPFGQAKAKSKLNGNYTEVDEEDGDGEEEEANETDPLLPPGSGRTTKGKTKKPFYRARPLWLVPFAITASLVRGMTLAPRVEVYLQLSCNRLHGDHHWNHTQTPAAWAMLNTSEVSPVSSSQSLRTSLYSSFDPLGPHLHPSSSPSFQPNPPPPSPPPSNNLSQEDQDRQDSDDTEDPRRLPSARCLGDAAVQAGAARLQTMMTTTMGLLSALTTGWWGHFGERNGRTRVLAVSTLGLFLTLVPFLVVSFEADPNRIPFFATASDLTFILVSTPSSPLAQHGHKLLLIAPIIEGLLGGWSTLQSATSAYLSDCTSPGSRAHIFSRFQGVFYLGFAVGPSVGGWFIQHPIRVISGAGGAGGNGAGQGNTKSVTSVFWVAVVCSFVNLLLVLFVFPESLGKKKREAAAALAAAASAATSAPGTPVAIAGNLKGKAKALTNEVAAVPQEAVEASPLVQEEPESQGIIARFLSPLSVFLPVVVLDPSPYGIGHRKRRDWSLTMLAVALFGFMLSTGIFQIKYLYAEHMYGWGAEQLSYYISAMGGARAMWLLFLLPTLIGFFKPKSKGNGKQPAGQQPVVPGKKPKPTRAQLGQEIKFDLTLTKCSLCIDILSHTLVTILPAPGMREHISAQAPLLTNTVGLGDATYKQSQAMFVLASSLNGLGSGAVPAIHSLALCMAQVRALDASGGVADSAKEDEGTGALFGALAVLQAVGQMILGPMLFGLIYSGTVAQFPKAIFVTAAGILVCALAIVMCVRNPVRVVSMTRAIQGGKRRRRDTDGERGRSRVSKDLRGGAVPYYGSASDESV